MTKAQKISEMLLEEFAKTGSMSQAFDKVFGECADKVFGECAYKEFAGQLYDEMRAK